MSRKVSIARLATGIPGLDAILGGGIPELSFNLIVGAPGCGKTTLAHQLMFAMASPRRPALYFTVLGESPIKMLRYQQQFSFFDLDKINGAVRFVSLGDDVTTGTYTEVLKRITREVETTAPALVFVDSFRSIMHEAQRQSEGSISQQQFIQQLGMQLMGWATSTFLVGEYSSKTDSPPIFTMADGLISLEQSVFRNSMVRKIQIMKMRGQATRPGMHTFRITDDGIVVYPAVEVRDDGDLTVASRRKDSTQKRLSMGVPRLDEMMGGGLPSGYSLLVAGPSGSGKTILATAFLVEGVRRGEPGVIVAFEQTPSQSRTRTIDDLVRAGSIGLINTRSLDLSMDEVIQHLIDLIHSMKAKRVVIDSLSGFELAVAPTFREDFRESLFRMIAALSNLGVTVLMTSELEDRYGDLRFSPYGSAFLTDAIIVQRYVEIKSCLKRVMAVVKVRASAHSNELREFEIDDGGIAIGEILSGYSGILSGSPALNPSLAVKDQDR
ncbi:circadian clock protein KaiC [Desulfomicrobium norvegicum]|uniref:non-specific serine/threonine protein kinase n=1 Tax=Desulfomicrobium norvegicum (strain DSM 1741 / NCIMB 8310) TaxID=52561 RepID=A0A8G2BZW4_DESNO|nr:ATPase domain-containing protein [Desulfomicrobium norvegicum]SFL28732.1 circadian clock protein KaiC [Desulfomicrobium norvegicum]